VLEEKRVEEGSSEEGEEEDGGNVFDKLLRPDNRIDGRSLNLGWIYRTVQECPPWGTEEDGEDAESEDEDEDTELSESSESSEEDYDSDSESESYTETASETDEGSGSEGASEEDPEGIPSSTRPPHDTTKDST